MNRKLLTGKRNFCVSGIDGVKKYKTMQEEYISFIDLIDSVLEKIEMNKTMNRGHLYVRDSSDYDRYIKISFWHSIFYPYNPGDPKTAYIEDVNKKICEQLYFTNVPELKELSFKFKFEFRRGDLFVHIFVTENIYNYSLFDFSYIIAYCIKNNEMEKYNSKSEMPENDYNNPLKYLPVQSDEFKNKINMLNVNMQMPITIEGSVFIHLECDIHRYMELPFLIDLKKISNDGFLPIFDIQIFDPEYNKIHSFNSKDISLQDFIVPDMGVKIENQKINLRFFSDPDKCNHYLRDYTKQIAYYSIIQFTGVDISRGALKKQIIIPEVPKEELKTVDSLGTTIEKPLPKGPKPKVIKEHKSKELTESEKLDAEIDQYVKEVKQRQLMRSKSGIWNWIKSFF